MGEGLGEEVEAMLFYALFFHPHLASPIKGEEVSFSFCRLRNPVPPFEWAF
jgi:hypothetical protein